MRTRVSLNALLGLCFVVVISLTSGCASEKTWIYGGAQISPVAGPRDKTVAVLVYQDLRTNRNSNHPLIGMVPLLPYGWQELNAPEGVGDHGSSGAWVNYKPTEDYPKALAYDLGRTGLFSDVFFDVQEKSADYAVKGKILSTKYSGHELTYFVGPYAAYLWLIGLPVETVRNELSLELSLVDSKSGETIFSKTYSTPPRSSTSWIYSVKNDFFYPEMLADINRQFCEDLQTFVKFGARP